MTCNDCFMSEVCDIRIQKDYKIRVLMGLPNAHCPYYKDESRIIELPCKVGNTVYFIKSAFSVLKEPKAEQVRKIEIYDIDTIFRTQNRVFNIAVVGETVFLTKEAAEHALKERDNNG